LSKIIDPEENVLEQD